MEGERSRLRMIPSVDSKDGDVWVGDLERTLLAGTVVLLVYLPRGPDTFRGLTTYSISVSPACTRLAITAGNSISPASSTFCSSSEKGTGEAIVSDEVVICLEEIWDISPVDTRSRSPVGKLPNCPAATSTVKDVFISTVSSKSNKPQGLRGSHKTLSIVRV